MMDQVLGPFPRGQRVGLADLLTGVIEYDSSGKFRRDLAEKLIHAQIKLAELGFSIGGEPVYGFRRWLVGPDRAPKRELEEGEVVKMSGHHVVWLPTAEDELRVVRRILDLIETVPAARIARMLIADRIPSPKAGRVRRVGGVAVANSGLWTQNTVKNVATHPLLIAVCEYGRRAMGDQLRLTPSGPRMLTDGDYRADGRPRAVANPDAGVIRTPAAFDPVIPAERHEAIRRVIEERGRHLRGKARTRGDSPNPLGDRIHDLNCGWLMYRHARRGGWGYQCGLYQNSQAACCAHNVVGGESTARFVLSCLRQRLLAPGTMAKLWARLEQLAAAEGEGDLARPQRESCRAELAAVERKLATVGRNMALAETPEERRATAGVFAELQAEAGRLRGRLRDLDAAPADRDPGRDVEAALAGLERMHELDDPSGRDYASIGELFRRVDAKLYLRFHAEGSGDRMINAPSGGVLTFGSTPPPGPMYDGPTGRAVLRARLAAGEPVAASPGGVPPGRLGTGPEANRSANVQRGTWRFSGPGRLCCQTTACC